jgi:hypothetical protein
LADTLAKAGAVANPKLLSETAPSALPLHTLYDLCKLPINIRIILPVEEGDSPSTPLEPEGGYAQPLKQLFQTRAKLKYQITSHRGEERGAMDTECTDLKLWEEGLKGKILHPTMRHLDSHFLKLASHAHTSIASLDQTNSTWKTARLRPPLLPPPIMAVRARESPTLARYTEAFKKYINTCPACDQLIPFKHYGNTMAHLLTECTHDSIRTAVQAAQWKLGERLTALGARQWWITPPSPPFIPTSDLPPISNGEGAATWAQLTKPSQARDDKRPDVLPQYSIKIDVPENKAKCFAAEYVHTYLTKMPVHPNPQEWHIRVSQKDCAAILHPELARTARSVYNIDTEMFACPPYFSPQLLHITVPTTRFQRGGDDKKQ